MMPKFRAWDQRNKKMQQVTTLELNTEGVWSIGINYEDPIIDPNDVILMQSSGLTDQNGTEIFEGDIIGKWPLTSVVKYYIPYGLWVAEFVKYNNYRKLSPVASDNQIIGNIYENPEMLEV